jgi:RNA polymerase sigma factor (sigma-70 family)
MAPKRLGIARRLVEKNLYSTTGLAALIWGTRSRPETLPMASGQLVPVIDFLRKVVSLPGVETLTDGQLLTWFVERDDEDAFTALVQRHGAMVYGVCLRVLHDVHDADDAFQATFLVLARKARAIRKRDSAASWLYGVAYRTAVKARAREARRQAHEREAPEMPHVDPWAELAWRELRPVLDHELERLPEKYRAPLVLCYLEGKTNEAAARQLGWTKGTVSGRLARARDLLRGRLARRGLALSGGLLTTALSLSAASAAVPAPLVASTVKAAALVAVGKAAAAGISAPVAALVEGVVQTMVMTKVKVAAAVVLAVTLMGAGAGMLTCGSQAADNSSGEKTVGVLPAGARPAGTAQTDLQRLQGTWTVQSVEASGSQASRERTKGAMVIFAGDQITTVEGGRSHAGIFTLVPTKTPKQLYIRIKGKEQVGAIYRFEGETLTLCVSETSQDPPKGFTAEAGTATRLIVLQRAKAVPAGNAEDRAPAGLREENERLRRDLERTRDDLERIREDLARARAEAQRFRDLAEDQLRRAQAVLLDQADRAKQQVRAARAAGQEARDAANQAPGTAEERRRSANNLKQIGLAMHSYHDVNKHFPPAAIYSKDGKPLLSWRVAILPWLEQDNLYKQFKLDEPWDSTHNKKLLAQMPVTFAPVRGKTNVPYGTYYQVFTGKETVFDGKEGIRITQIPDGTSNTILAVEAEKAVPWTKPDDLAYAPGKALPKLGGLLGNGFHILWADGSVQFVRQPVNEQMLRWAITRNDAMVVDREKLER